MLHEPYLPLRLDLVLPDAVGAISSCLHWDLARSKTAVILTCPAALEDNLPIGPDCHFGLDIANAQHDWSSIVRETRLAVNGLRGDQRMISPTPTSGPSTARLAISQPLGASDTTDFIANPHRAE